MQRRRLFGLIAGAFVGAMLPKPTLAALSDEERHRRLRDAIRRSPEYQRWIQPLAWQKEYWDQKWTVRP